MPREIRLVILSLGLVLAGLLGRRAVQPAAAASTSIQRRIVLLGALGIIAIGATITVIQRIVHVRRQANTSHATTIETNGERAT